MNYTNKMNFNELKKEVLKIGEEHGFKVYIEKHEDNQSIDGKVSTTILVESRQCEIRFYDYKVTSLYDSDFVKPATFRRKSYNWHVQANDQLMMVAFNSILEAN